MLKIRNIKNFIYNFHTEYMELNTSYGIINCNEKIAFDSKKTRSPVQKWMGINNSEYTFTKMHMEEGMENKEFGNCC